MSLPVPACPNSPFGCSGPPAASDTLSQCRSGGSRCERHLLGGALGHCVIGHWPCRRPIVGRTSKRKIFRNSPHHFGSQLGHLAPSSAALCFPVSKLPGTFRATLLSEKPRSKSHFDPPRNPLASLVSSSYRFFKISRSPLDSVISGLGSLCPYTLVLPAGKASAVPPSEKFLCHAKSWTDETGLGEVDQQHKNVSCQHIIDTLVLVGCAGPSGLSRVGRGSIPSRSARSDPNNLIMASG